MAVKILERFKNSPLAIIATTVAITNWQLLFGIKATLWDMMNFWLPWRKYISECYTNGIVPLWNPYAQAGYPIQGDLQGPAYSPEAILDSFLPVNVYSLGYIYIFYLIIGAFGMQKFISFFIKSFDSVKELPSSQSIRLLTSVILGIVFGICGYNAWHGHYLYITISACLIPWIYYYFFRLLNEPAWVDALKLSFFIWWQITAGNPSFIIVSFYLLFIVYIVINAYYWKAKDFTRIKKTLLNFLLTAVVTTILCAPVFLNAYYIFPETSRASGISVEWAAEESIRWPSVFSFISSLTCIEREIQIGNNAPIYGLYLAIPVLFFAIIGIIKFRNKWLLSLHIIAAIALLLSLGQQTPLFALFHKHLPFFNVFRMPNLIVIYFLMYICITASLGFIFSSGNKNIFRYFIWYAVFILIFNISGILYFKFIYKETGIYTTSMASIHEFLWTASQHKKLFVSFVMNVALLSTCAYFYKKQKFHSLLFIILLDACLNYNLGASARVYSPTSASYTNSFIEKLPSGFAPPENISDKEISCIQARMNALWMNTSILLQQPFYDNQNNFELSNYMKLFYGKTEELNYFKQLPFAFLADSVTSLSKFNPASAYTIAPLYDSLYIQEKYNGVKKLTGDTIICNQLHPHHMLFSVSNQSRAVFIIKQNLTSLWKVKVNGKDFIPDLAFYSFPAITLEKGSNLVEFCYESHYTIILLTLSLITGCGLFYIIILKTRKGPARYFILLTFSSYLIYCLISFFNGAKTLEESTLNKELQTCQDILTDKNIKSVTNTKDTYKTDTFNTKHYNFFYNEDIEQFLTELKEIKENKLACIDYKSIHQAELDMLLSYFYGDKITEESINYGQVTLYDKNKHSSKSLFSYSDNFTPKNVQKDSSTDGRLCVMAGNEYGGGTNFIIKDIHAKPHDLIYFSLLEETNAQFIPGLCLSIERNGANKAFISYKTQRNKQSGRTCLLYRIPEWISDEDKITLFYWNNSPVPAFIDDLKIEVISAQQ